MKVEKKKEEDATVHQGEIIIILSISEMRAN